MEKKQEKNKTLTIRCNQSHLDLLTNISRQMDTSQGWIVRKAIQEYHAKYTLEK